MRPSMFIRLSSPKTTTLSRFHLTNRKYSTALTLSPPPQPPSSPKSPTKPKHHDLQSFLSTTEVSRTDTVYLGTKYEYTVQSSLTRLGFNLTHNGGASDFGIDLLGTWTLPSSTILKVLIQCKSTAQKTQPSVIRELEGVFVGAPVEWRGPGGVIAFLASRRPASKGVRDAMGRSRWPMGFLSVDGEGRVVQMLWNRRADDEGLAGVGVCVRYPGVEETCKVVNLTWKGEPLEEG